MNRQQKNPEITNGPDKFRLMTALFVTEDVTELPTFTLESKVTIHINVISVSRVNSSNEVWYIRGFINNPKEREASGLGQGVNMHYSTKTRDGFVRP